MTIRTVNRHILQKPSPKCNNFKYHVVLVPPTSPGTVSDAFTRRCTHAAAEGVEHATARCNAVSPVHCTWCRKLMHQRIRRCLSDRLYETCRLDLNPLHISDGNIDATASRRKSVAHEIDSGECTGTVVQHMRITSKIVGQYTTLPPPCKIRSQHFCSTESTLQVPHNARLSATGQILSLEQHKPHTLSPISHTPCATFATSLNHISHTP